MLGWEASWCDLSDRGLGIGWSMGRGVIMAGVALAGNQKFCSAIWSFHNLGGCFYRILHK